MEKSPGHDQRVLDIAVELARELHPGRAVEHEANLDSSLTEDLGIDSLGRAELMVRLEREFGASLPEAALSEVRTPRDLAAAVEVAAEHAIGAPREARREPLARSAVAELPEQEDSLCGVLDWHARTHPERTHLHLLEDDVATDVSYGELSRDALRVAKGLADRGLEPGDRVALLLPTGREFFDAFFGTLYAGGVPVPIYPPLRASQIEEHLRRQVAILTNAGVAALLTFQRARPVATFLRGEVPSLRSVESVADLYAGEPLATPHRPRSEHLAFLQYTSGSTGDPKGVRLTHANLLANIRAMGRMLEISSTDVFVSWLPLYHDMGLIGAWLGSLYYAAPVAIMSPLAFLSRPDRWLWAIHRYHATLSAAPNFAFELCLKRLDPERLEGLDLSSLRMVVNGAEPVSASTVRRFTDAFAPYGFRASAMAPSYGLAEDSVGLTFPPPGRPPIVDRVDREALTRRGEALPAGPEDPHALEFVACGQPLPHHDVRIVDDAGRELPERREGNVQFRGPSATAGYYRNEAKTRELFDGYWLRTGDLGYVADGDLYLTGRTKDLIIRGGRNVYPQELEEAVGDIDGVRKGCVAVFGSPDPRTHTERLIVLAETRESEHDARTALERRIVEVSTDVLESPPDEVVLAPPRTVLKTSSGKLRRAACRELFEAGRIGRPGRAVWRQVASLSWRGAVSATRRRARGVIDSLYAAWWWTGIGIGFVIAWPLVALTRRPAPAWSVARLVARLWFGWARIPLMREGAPPGPDGEFVFVANHSSYLDGFALLAVLDRPVRFVAKKELASQRVAGTLLRGLGVLFVERFDAAESVADADRAAREARRGAPLFFFPEGTFQRRSGLLPFHLGAFFVATRTGEPVVPVAIRGTRAILPSGTWFPRRGSVRVVFGAPIAPEGDDWDAAVQLSNAARTAMLDMTGEADLDERSRAS